MSKLKHLNLRILLTLLTISIATATLLLLNIDNNHVEITQTQEQTIKQINKNYDDYEKIMDNLIKDNPSSMQVYFYTKYYARKYNVPENIMFAIAKKESNYSNPMNFKYNHRVKSYAGNYVGTYQICSSTATAAMGKKVTTHELMNDVKTNTESATKLMRKLYDKNKDWELSLGEYNTGKPCRNNYAKSVYRNSKN